MTTTSAAAQLAVNPFTFDPRSRMVQQTGCHQKEKNNDNDDGNGSSSSSGSGSSLEDGSGSFSRCSHCLQVLQVAQGHRLTASSPTTSSSYSPLQSPPSTEMMASSPMTEVTEMDFDDAPSSPEKRQTSVQVEEVGKADSEERLPVSLPNVSLFTANCHDVYLVHHHHHHSKHTTTTHFYTHHHHHSTPISPRASSTSSSSGTP